MLLKYSLLYSIIAILIMTISFSAADDDTLQDFCATATANNSQKGIFINGFPCKNPSDTDASDFKNTKLRNVGDTDNCLQSSTTLVTAAEYPGLNTLGLSMARIDLGEHGAVSPHTHPRSSEILFVERGVVSVGFLDTQKKVFQKFLKKGDVFIVPRGLLHYFLNPGYELATVFSFFNSQNPGVLSFTDALFVDDDDEAAAKRFRKKTLADHMMRMRGDDFSEKDAGCDFELKTESEEHRSEL